MLLLYIVYISHHILFSNVHYFLFFICFWQISDSFFVIFSSVAPSQRSAHSQVPSQVATHKEIGSQLWAGEMPDSNLGLQDSSLACCHWATTLPFSNVHSGFVRIFLLNCLTANYCQLSSALFNFIVPHLIIVQLLFFILILEMYPRYFNPVKKSICHLQLRVNKHYNIPDSPTAVLA